MDNLGDVQRDMDKERAKARRRRKRAVRRESLIKEQRRLTNRIAERQREIDRLDTEDRNDQ